MTGLLESTQSLVEMTDLACRVWSRVFWKLMHVDNLLTSKFSVQVGAFDIDLMNLKVFSSSQCKYRLNQRELCNRSKGVKVVDTRHLSESLGHQLSFVSNEITS